MKIAGACGRLALYQSTLALGPPPRRPSLPRPAAADELGALEAVMNEGPRPKPPAPPPPIPKPPSPPPGPLSAS